jgi:hypothetical protein
VASRSCRCTTRSLSAPPRPGRARGPARWSIRCSCRRRDCPSPAKHPIGRLVPRGLHNASRDPAVVADWWTRHPSANIGLATGHLFDVLDIDGAGGAAALRSFATEHDLASTGPLVRTGSGGWHYCEVEDARGCVLGLV